MIDQLATIQQYEAQQRAFVQGMDARLGGLPASANPYLASVWEEHWRRGWLEVECCYGMYVHGRWPIRALPPVMEEDS